ncbi:hypothetical protein CRI94_16995 [Longibacter salinarum]|uniref:Glycoside hydrolase n=1 Tax=Longibacter salinarum TaxID=1850348 RepID=A0A2A8CTV0_9BACT|nr:hypothetical protein CRI94_16995 [Longibacter salinarum]
MGALAFLLGLVFGIACTDRPESSEEPGTASAEVSDVPAATFDIRAVTLDARDRPSDDVLDAIASLGASDITLIPFGFQETPHTPAIRRHTDGGWYSESTRGIRDLASRAAARDLGVILKPHIWIGHYSADGQERDAIGFDAEGDWASWEVEYREFMLYYARLAEEVDARALVIGCELNRAVRERPAFWRSLIAEVRSVYDGKLTYAANWSEDLRQIEFWDALDYVGVQAYFPLVHDSTRGDSVTVEQLQAGWDRHAHQLEAIHRATGRPLLFTELGYRSDPDAARAPWRWPEDGEKVEPDPAMQARCYRAFFQALGSANWLGGAIVWKWHPEPESKRPTGFTPQNKPAAAILRQGFGAAG